MSAEVPAQIVQLTPISPEFDADLSRQFSVARLFGGPDSDHKMELASMARVAVTSVRRGLSKADISAFPALEAVCSWGVGYDTLDIEAAYAAGIRIANTPDVLDDCVAYLAWTLLMATARRVSVADTYVKTGGWKRLGDFPLTSRVSGKRLGILGLGRIGRAIARRGSGFSMDIRYHARRPVTDVAYIYEAELEALARWADFLVVAIPANAGTRHIVNEAVLAALGPGGILVNIARGSVVDQTALASALEEGELGGAGLDVLETEPFPRHPFPAASDRVVLTPHVGSATMDTRRAMENLVFDNVREFLTNGFLRTEIPRNE